mgnify:FL=1
MSEQSNESGKTVGIIIIVVFALAGLVGLWYWVMYKPQQEAKEQVKLEQIAKEQAAKKASELRAQNKTKYDQLIKDADAEMGQENW